MVIDEKESPAHSHQLPRLTYPLFIPLLADHQRGHCTQIAAAAIQCHRAATTTVALENKLPLNHAPEIAQFQLDGRIGIHSQRQGIAHVLPAPAICLQRSGLHGGLIAGQVLFSVYRHRLTDQSQRLADNA